MKFCRGVTVKNHTQKVFFSGAVCGSEWNTEYCLSAASWLFVATCLTKLCTHLLQYRVLSACQQEAGLWSRCTRLLYVSLVTRLTVSSCMHPAYFLTQGLKPRILADPSVAVLPGQPRPFRSLATSGIAGLGWMLLLYSLRCFRHYLWLTWRKKDVMLLFRGKLFYTVNILTVLWAWDAKAWHILPL